jgi:hypothetical protein
MIDGNIFQLQETLSWIEVFAKWEQDESKNPEWEKLYTQRGFPNWKTWRGRYAETIGLSGLTWGRYLLFNPLTNVPKFRCAPFMSWVQNAYNGKMMPTFEEIAQTKFVQQQDGITKIMQTFHDETTIIAVQTSLGVVVIEGTRRSCALARAVNARPHLRTKVWVLLAQMPGITAEVTKRLSKLYTMKKKY